MAPVEGSSEAAGGSFVFSEGGGSQGAEQGGDASTGSKANAEVEGADGAVDKGMTRIGEVSARVSAVWQRALDQVCLFSSLLSLPPSRPPSPSPSPSFLLSLPAPPRPPLSKGCGEGVQGVRLCLCLCV